MNPDEIDAARLQDARDDEEREHELSADCWCEPEVIDYSEPGDDAKLDAALEESARHEASYFDAEPPSWRDKWDTEAEFRGER